MPLIIYTVLTKKKVWGQPPRPLKNSNYTLSSTLPQLPATKIIVRITIVIDHPSLPTKKRISGFLYGILCMLMTTRVLLSTINEVLG